VHPERHLADRHSVVDQLLIGGGGRRERERTKRGER
jgi:hypothetical protein